MFEKIPAVVVETLENNDLLIYSCRIKMSKRGPVLHTGAMFPYMKNKWPKMSKEESEELIADVKKELRKLGYRVAMKMFTHPDTDKTYFNDFRVKVILEEGRDLTPEYISTMVRATKRARRAQKRAAQYAKLSTRL